MSADQNIETIKSIYEAFGLDDRFLIGRARAG
jgi:hypothetical protein